MKHLFRKILLAVLSLSLCLSLAGCGQSIDAKSISKTTKSEETPTGNITKERVLATYAFALSLLGATKDGSENQLLSPLSVMLALGMTANGANGQTKEEMEKAMGLSVEELNGFLLGFLESADTENLQIAQSIWFKNNGLSIKDSFLQTNTDYYGADAFSAPFDQSTVSDINAWVSENTHGMIDKLVDQISPEQMMYLISAMAFEADWEKKYNKSQVEEGIFTDLEGQKQTVEMMNSNEYYYLCQGDAYGLLKYYEGGRYAFAGILPPEGMSPADYLASLTAEDFAALLSTPQAKPVVAQIPVFSFEGDYLLNQALAQLGMNLAFSDLADFSGIDATAPLCISEVKHKTFIDVNPDGTKAAAVTSIGMIATSIGPVERMHVSLDRPFVMVLLDTQTGLPLFVGTVNTVK